MCQLPCLNPPEWGSMINFGFDFDFKYVFPAAPISMSKKKKKTGRALIALNVIIYYI